MPVVPDNFIAYIKRLHPYISDDDLSVIGEIAASDLYNLTYPVGVKPDFAGYQIPARRKTWVLKRMIEIIERQGCSSLVGYTENGLHAVWDNSQISNALINEITPNVGIPEPGGGV